MLGKYLESTKEKNALIHCLTNYVTVNDVANILIASGASPIMADDKAEVEEINSFCQGLYLNIGTLNSRTIESMQIAAKKANELNKPIVLDPVGVGASKLRTTTAKSLIENHKLAVIRGNITEIKNIAHGIGTTHGVDSLAGDEGAYENINSVIELTQELANKLDAIIIATGICDVISYKNQSYIVRNGHPKMSKITGSGCMLGALITAFISSNPEDIFKASVAAVMAMGIAGEIAFERMSEFDGNSSYRNYLIDAIDNLDVNLFNARGRYECR